jgi:hypothetical protein
MMGDRRTCSLLNTLNTGHITAARTGLDSIVPTCSDPSSTRKKKPRRSSPGEVQDETLEIPKHKGGSRHV